MTTLYTLQATPPAKRLAAFTLIEVVVSAAVFILAGVGILSGMLFSYQTAVKTRVHDQAWVVLRSFADQFTDSRRDPFSNPERTAYNSLWEPTTNFTGLGLTWPDNTPGVTTQASDDRLNLQMTYPGVTGSSGVVAVNVQRNVELFLSDPAAGGVLDGSNPALMLRGTFRVTYTLQNKTYTEQLVVTRSARF